MSSFHCGRCFSPDIEARMSVFIQLNTDQVMDDADADWDETWCPVCMTSNVPVRESTRSGKGWWNVREGRIAGVDLEYLKPVEVDRATAYELRYRALETRSARYFQWYRLSGSEAPQDSFPGWGIVGPWPEVAWL